MRKKIHLVAGARREDRLREVADAAGARCMRLDVTDQASVDATEQLCWVCRRLKISAWREIEQQAPMSE